jgi:hypothetical protein
MKLQNWHVYWFSSFSNCIQVCSPCGLKSDPLLMSFFVIHVIVLATCTNIVKLYRCKCSFDIILIDHSPIYLWHIFIIDFFFTFSTYDKLIRGLKDFMFLLVIFKLFSCIYVIYIYIYIYNWHIILQLSMHPIVGANVNLKLEKRGQSLIHMF